MSGLNAEIEKIKELFKSKIKDIADKITTDATTISGIADRMREIVTNSGNASHKISELRVLIEQVDRDQNLSNARQKYASELNNLNSALDGKSPDTSNSSDAAEGSSSSWFGLGKPTGFMKQLKQYAMQRLIENKIKLSNDDFKALITDKTDTALARNYTNLNDNTTTDYIDPNTMASIRREIVHYMNTHKTDLSKPIVKVGGFLSNSRKLKRPSRKNTRDFFKFTRKSSEKPQGAKKLRKSRRKARRKANK
jgi:hypothetical protein